MLELMIEETREKMILLALELGFTARETIICSQQLDILINMKLATSCKNDKLPNFMFPETQTYMVN